MVIFPSYVYKPLTDGSRLGFNPPRGGHGDPAHLILAVDTEIWRN